MISASLGTSVGKAASAEGERPSAERRPASVSGALSRERGVLDGRGNLRHRKFLEAVRTPMLLTYGVSCIPVVRLCGLLAPAEPV